MAQASKLQDQSSPPDRILQRVAEAIRDLRFGSVEIVVHDGKVVQIERREKLRIENTQRG